MNKEQLKNIFDNSTCLTPRQLRGYASGKMVHEEAHAVETHLLSCPFCSEAVEGLVASKSPLALDSVDKMDSSFLEKYLNVSQEDLNAKPKYSGAAKFSTMSAPAVKSTKLWKNIGIAASVLIAVGAIWILKDTVFNSDEPASQIAEVNVIEDSKPLVEQPLAVVADSTIPEEDNTADEQIVATTDTVSASQTLDAAKDAEAQKLTALDAKKQQQELKAKKEAEQKAKEKEREKALLAAAEKSDKKTTVAQANKTSETSADYDGYGPRRLGNSFTDEATTASAPAAKKAPEPISLGSATTGISKADEAFNEENYKRALRLYQKEMFDKKSQQQDAATYMAAKCHIALGEKVQARTLLNSLIKENSYKKGEAQQLLNKLD